jgi:hypothetical protein
VTDEPCESKEPDPVPPPMPRRKVTELVRKGAENLWGGEVPGDETAFIEWMERTWREDNAEKTRLRKQITELRNNNRILEDTIVGLACLATGNLKADLVYDTDECGRWKKRG